MSSTHVFNLLMIALLALIPLKGFAKTCNVAIGSNDAMQFDKHEIRIAADCTQVKLTLRHTGALPAEVMGHNWVLTRTADLEALATAAGKLPADSDHVPKGDARVLAASKVVGGGQATTLTFATSVLRKGGDYTFFCSVPGHWTMMKGKLVFG
ncbi:azurin [Pseudoxanthomonas sp. Root630]|uniref:azurin n=1 Tax=Pseudoxanthomonas sp. Root630 TaxID=1736574 RepID=UPI000702F7A3|nr:azurin [Pseudoxanthomonas sp. Root630]KRA46335.1 azurin [Pseudoxanthomonas sp. Root630]